MSEWNFMETEWSNSDEPFELEMTTTCDTSSESDSDNKDTEEIIRKAGFFHGFLSREDAIEMLENDGDFLVRETVIQNQPEIVLSVKWEDKKNPCGKWKHFRIQVTYTGYFTVNTKLNFESIQDLLLFHWEHKDDELSDDSDAVIMNPTERNPWEFLSEQIEVGPELGQGVFGKVRKGILRQQSGEAENVAVKLCDTKDFKATEEFFREARNLRTAKHPNVCEFIGISTFKSPLKLITKLYDKGQLKRFLMVEGKKLAVQQKVRFGLDVSKALKHISKLGILHLDVCVRNCLVKSEDYSRTTGELGAVIADFGLSRATTTHGFNRGENLPRRWMAPELLDEGKLEATVKSEVWSFGILLWEIFSNGEAPYPEISDDKFLKHYLTEQNQRMEARPNTPGIVQELMGKCWQENPLNRPSFAECKIQLASCYNMMKDQR